MPQVKNWLTGETILEYEGELSVALIEAVQKGTLLVRANLIGANLRSANLIGANLRSADLSGANLRSADLSGANLRSADLSGANLRSANLIGANLRSANLIGANLRSADLSGANLRSADLSGANLRSANLIGANLSEIKNDFLAEVLKLPDEIPFLRQALIEGKIDGSTYSGECACLAGTMAHARKIEEYAGDSIEVCEGLKFMADSSSPRERWFLGIRKGDTPETSNLAQVTLGWIDEALAMVANIRGR